MYTFISSNLATILISGLLLAVVLWIITDMIKKQKSGKSPVCSGCSGCPSAGLCHKNQNQPLLHSE